MGDKFDLSDLDKRLADIAGNSPHDVIYRQARSMIDALHREIDTKDALIDQLYASMASERQSRRAERQFLDSALAHYRAEETKP